MIQFCTGRQMEDLTSEEVAAFEGLDYSYQKMYEELEEMAPICHFTKMNYEYGDNYGDEDWWECIHCGHTKKL